jgi:hypothetical protein
MAKTSDSTGWVSINKAEEMLGLDRKTLFRFRDNGTLKLGTHFTAFPGKTWSRDSYYWNVNAVQKHLQKQIHFQAASVDDEMIAA